LGVTKQGLSAIVATSGNPDGHVILRGASSGPNYDAASVSRVAASLSRAGRVPRIMIDCSHGNSSRDPARQPLVARDVGLQLRAGSRAIAGLMLESHLVAGRQDPPSAGRTLTYGQSITDACLGWDDTASVLNELAEHVRTARAHR
jgi:3-deoxy-7-phosphoheptulonate synthase